jgi:cell division protein FtsN
MAPRKRSRPKKPSRGTTSGWLSMVFGLSVGLVVAAAIYIGDRRAPLPAVATQPPPSQAQPTDSAATDAAAVSDEAQPATRFDFYEMLPQFEVVIPEVEQDASLDREATAVEEPGSYVLQAGSFKALADADRMQANLALLGIESRIQRVAIDDDLYHRVRIGPTDDLRELNQIRRRLWDAEIEVLLIKVPK